MIEKVVAKYDLTDPDAARRDLEYWLTRTPEERVEAVEILRRQFYGNPGRIQKIARVIQRS
jgi:hypothetical protein